MDGCKAAQQMPVALLDSAVKGEAVGAAFGDAMSINVLMRVVPRALYAAGLIQRLPFDIWARRPPAEGILPDATYQRGKDVGDKF